MAKLIFFDLAIVLQLTLIAKVFIVVSTNEVYNRGQSESRESCIFALRKREINREMEREHFRRLSCFDYGLITYVNECIWSNVFGLIFSEAFWQNCAVTRFTPHFFFMRVPEIVSKKFNASLCMWQLPATYRACSCTRCE